MSRAKRTLKERFESHINKESPHTYTDPDGNTTPCWTWNTKKGNINKYIRMEDEAGHTVYGHRLSHEYYIGPIAPGLCVCHHCDHPGCVNPEHLFEGTQEDNNKDRSKKGRTARMYGEKNPQSKLTVEQVKEIKDKLAISKGKKVRLIGREYHVSHPVIMSIRDGKTWSTV